MIIFKVKICILFVFITKFYAIDENVLFMKLGVVTYLLTRLLNDKLTMTNMNILYMRNNSNFHFIYII